MAGIERRGVAVDADGEGGHHPGRGLGDLGGETAVDQARGQVPEQIGHHRPGQLLDQLGETRPDALQRPHRPEQRIENLGPHASPPNEEIPAVWTATAGPDYTAPHAPGDRRER